METKHNLDFESAEWRFPEFKKFRVGTCEGLWRSTAESYDILSIINRSPGNGHFEDVLEWFEASCRRDNKCLQILEIWNKRFRIHLIDKRGFEVVDEENLSKKFY